MRQHVDVGIWRKYGRRHVEVTLITSKVQTWIAMLWSRWFRTGGLDLLPCISVMDNTNISCWHSYHYAVHKSMLIWVKSFRYCSYDAGEELWSQRLVPDGPVSETDRPPVGFPYNKVSRVYCKINGGIKIIIKSSIEVWFSRHKSSLMKEVRGERDTFFFSGHSGYITCTCLESYWNEPYADAGIWHARLQLNQSHSVLNEWEKNKTLNIKSDCPEKHEGRWLDSLLGPWLHFDAYFPPMSGHIEVESSWNHCEVRTKFLQFPLLCLLKCITSLATKALGHLRPSFPEGINTV